MIFRKILQYCTVYINNLNQCHWVICQPGKQEVVSEGRNKGRHERRILNKSLQYEEVVINARVIIYRNKPSILFNMTERVTRKSCRTSS